jgi:type III secretion system needle length determinant
VASAARNAAATGASRAQQPAGENAGRGDARSTASRAPAAAAEPLAQSPAGVTSTGAVAASKAPAPAAGVDMREMIEAIRASVDVSARGGIAQARIALSPEELGGIRIHLTQTRDGLLARLTADTDAGAQALQAGRSELAHSLRSIGSSPVRLEIGTSAQSDQQQGARAGTANSGATGRGQTGSNVPPADEELEGLPAAEGAVAQTPKGVLVDVLV